MPQDTYLHACRLTFISRSRRGAGRIGDDDDLDESVRGRVRELLGAISV